MKLAAKGTELFVLNTLASPDEILKIGCPTAINPGGATTNQIDTTCLDDDVDTFIAGNRTPDAFTFDVIFDNESESHKILEDMADDGGTFQWYLGFSDGEDDPTLSAGDIVAPTNRTGRIFSGSVANVAWNIAAGDAVRGTVTVQRSGNYERFYKTAF